MNNDMEWNAKQLQILRSLWAEGLSTAEIGRRMNVSKNAIVGKAHRINLPPRPSPIRRGHDAAQKTAPPRRAQGKMLPPLQSCEEEVEAAPAPVVIAKRVAVSIACCWPIGEPRKADFRFCDAPSAPGRPYCEHHCDHAYVASRRGREVAFDPWA